MKYILLYSLLLSRQLFAHTVSQEDLNFVGKKIWHNECRGTQEGLISWNKGEEFASLGIGHFIWYPKNYSGPFVEQFPELLKFFEEHGRDIKFLGLDVHYSCPWQTREAFLAAREDVLLTKLRALLADTVDLQTQFILKRLEAALPKLTAQLSASEKKQVTAQFNRLLQSGRMGIYALIDYINFKGEGTAVTERYAGKGWGLLQVLQGMHSKKPGNAALQEFSAAAEQVLRERVKNSPPERGEERWLAGWIKRVKTYAE